MEPISLKDIVASSRGVLLGDENAPDLKVQRIISDSRKAQKGDLFVALSGTVDGHRFVNSALQAGAICALVSHKPDQMLPGRYYILVDDTLQAVGRIAAWYRSRFDIPVVAVTGSVGKTTTKDMIAAALSARFDVTRTQANFNNNIGLPRTIFTMDRHTRIAVLEMGMNHFGEIDYLVRIARPTIAVITNIGDAHIGNLGSRENIFKAKCEIFNGLQEGGTAVLNGDDPFLIRLKDDPQIAGRFHLVYVGESRECGWRAVNIHDELPQQLRFEVQTDGRHFPVVVPSGGRHMIYPVLTAAAICAEQGMSAAEIKAGIAGYQATGMRMETRRFAGNITILNDTYNANPQSMKAGLELLSKTPAARHVAVLGDMLEQGSETRRLHSEIGAYAAQLGIDTLVTVGEASHFMAKAAREKGLKDVRDYDKREEAEQILPQLIGPDTAVLFKASRGLAFEQLVAAAQKLLQKA